MNLMFRHGSELNTSVPAAANTNQRESETFPAHFTTKKFQFSEQITIAACFLHYTVLWPLKPYNQLTDGGVYERPI